MYLKKIEIYGFKSFGNKVEVLFDSNVTSIVGPNGSGKSNIVDAVRWVLGEQRVKSLRGSKMEDVIFQGTEEKKSLGYASVSITLDNANRMFPIDYNELNIQRRLFRSGESEYYINKNQVRLKDISELLMDTGLSREGYSIISQGQIESIVNTSAVERKLMIEEAVGIVKYKTRKNEATKKLDKTVDNLSRILDIVTELEKRLPSLKRNSKKAITYLDLKEKLKNIELNLFIHQMDKYKVDLEKINEDEKIINDGLISLSEEISLFDLKYQTLRGSLSSYDEKLMSTNEDIKNLIKNYENSKTLIEVCKSKIENHTENITKIETILNELKTSKEEKEKEKENTSAKLNDVKTKLTSVKEVYESMKKEVNDLYIKSEESSSYIEIINDKLKNLENALKNKNEEFANLLNDIKNNSFIEERLSSENLALNENIFKSENILKELNNEKEVEIYNELNKAFNDTLISENKKQKEYENHKEELSNIYNKINMLKDKKELFISFEESKEGYKFSIKRLFEYIKSQGSLKTDVYGTLIDLIKVEPKYQKAIEKALMASAENVVTKDEFVASKLIKALKENKWGQVTFLPHSIIKGNKLNETFGDEGFISLASDIVKYDNKFKNIIDNALGRVVIVDTLSNANKFSKNHSYRFKVVTLDGEILLPGGAIIGGESKRDKSSVLSRKNEILKLEKDIKDLSSSYEEKLNKNNNFIKELKEENEKKEKALNELNDFKVSLKDKTNKINLENEKIKETKNLIFENNKKITRSKEEIVKANEEKNKLNEKISSINEEITSIKEEINKASLGIYKDEYVEKARNLNKEEIEYIKLLESEKALKETLDNLNYSLDDIIKNQVLNKEEIEIINADINILNEKMMEAIKTDKDYEVLKKNLDDSFYSLNQKKKEASEEFEIVDKKIRDLTNEKFDVSSNLQKITGKKEKLEIQMTYLNKDIFENYNLTYHEAYNYKKDEINLLKSSEEVASLKKEIKELGNINVDSIDEYKEVKDRFDFLSKQRDDLLLSKEELAKIIKDITVKIEEKFIKEFEQIQVKFDKVFKKLFNGGSARLILTAPDDVIESGIDIIASPPGTKLKNIASLSGGEKSLTAIALIFAILELKPSPFCVLDEIDAALDDANVYRFSKYVESIKEENQFIIVTHRKQTMEIADVLYGATMGIDGVTKLISLKLSDAKEYGNG